MRVNDLPEVERPSFKLRYFGAKRLSNTELIQLVTGVDDFDAAEMILSESGGLPSIRDMNAEEFLGVSGVGKSSAAKLAAAAELGARMTAETPYKRQRIFEAEDVAKMLSPSLSGEKQELVILLLLNAKYEVIGTETLPKGGIVSAGAEPRDVFRPAVKCGATGVIVVHNHPGGDPSPSKDDLIATEQIEKAGEVIGIKLIDHIIIGDGRHTSLRDMNVLDNKKQLNSIVANLNEKDQDRERER